MLIGIESSRANRLQKTGVEWYAYHVIQQMKQDPQTAKHSWLLYGNEPLSMGLEKGPNNWHERSLSWPPKYLWTQLRLSWEMFRRPPEVLYVPAHVLPRFAPKRSVVTIHDVGFHRFPELYKPIQRAYHEWSTKDIVKKGARIITVSEFCKQEIMECYGAKADQIFVTHLGVEHDRYQPQTPEKIKAVLDQYRIPTPYLLFVGRLDEKKNIVTLIEAFHRFKEARGQGDPLHLVLAGRPANGSDKIMQAVEASGHADQISVLGYVSEVHKPMLMSGALAYVQPSYYEGFGLPPLEAMACGCPVISSNSTSLPEVLGERTALFFDPKDPEALEACIARVVDEEPLRNELRDRGLAWASQYSWPKTARQTLEALVSW